jgi:hypothetical protein
VCRLFAVLQILNIDKENVRAKDNLNRLPCSAVVSLKELARSKGHPAYCLIYAKILFESRANYNKEAPSLTTSTKPCGVGITNPGSLAVRSGGLDFNYGFCKKEILCLNKLKATP